MNKNELEERLIDFSVIVMQIADTLSKTYAGQHLSGQLIRSGTSPALNYGEAQAAESRKDFIHKMKIALKELRETYVCLRILIKLKLYKTKNQIDKAFNECDELISIFVKSITTAQRNDG